MVAQSVIDLHLAKFEPSQRAALLTTCAAVRAALPGADEVIAYGMPTFKVDGVAVLGLDGFKSHNSLFPYSGSVVELVRAELPDFGVSKGTVRFPLDRPFPAGLLNRIVRIRILEINEGYPKKSGEVKEFYPNGYLKATGKVKDGELHGAWKWFRKDGTIMRSGSFKAGQKTGDWTTYTRDETPYKVTRH
ncbi:MAG TPA: DUF1801 domain-containing protein [Actinomycetota bacterium]|nr:DUF1801 domain-containing protein [Actinomycetota bacterium]